MDFRGKITPPTKHNIMKTSKFGKLSQYHSFTSEASFDHILIFMFKGNYLSEEDIHTIHNIHPLYKHFHKMLLWSSHINFIDIKDPIKDYANQAEINVSRIQKILAASFHYDLDIPTLIRFLGGNFTGEYRDVDSTMNILKETKCDTKVMEDLHRVFKTGCPNKMNAHSSHKNFMQFLRYGNHSSIDKDIAKTKKAMNKEDRNQFLIPLPMWLARFIKNLHVTPQGLVVKPGKNDRLIWDGSFIPNWQATCINMMLSQATEPEIVYGTTFMKHLESIWNLRITYPNTDILLFDDDVKGAFRHSKYHPDIASAFSFIISNLLFIPLGGTFGSITSPANFEPIARARTHLAEALSYRRDLLKKYEHIINKVKFSEEPQGNINYVQAVIDKFHKGCSNKEKTKFNMFVDDSLFAQIRGFIKHAMAASIEALYIILSFPDVIKRQDPLSLDKYFESTCSFKRTQIGIDINTRTMSIALSEKKRIAMLDELSHWHKKRKSFTLLQGVVLCGSLEFWATTSSWIRFIYDQLRSAVNKSLLNCSKITKSKKEIKALITDLAHTKNIDDHDLKEKHLRSKIARDTYKCEHKAFIDKEMRKELNIMIQILSNPQKFSLQTPIAHIITREADFTSYGDACLEAGGGYSQNLFW